MKNASFKIAGLGEILWDVYETEKFIGGAPANFTAHVRKCGEKAFLLSSIGSDQLGEELKARLETLQIDMRGLQTSTTKPTGTVGVTVDAHGQPHFECSKNAAFDDMRCNRAWRNLAPELDAILFGTLAQREPISRDAIQTFLGLAKSPLKIFDINLRNWSEDTGQIIENGLNNARIIKFNESELIKLQSFYTKTNDTPHFFKDLMTIKTLDMIAVTYGDKGCWIVSEDDSVRHPGFHVPVVDTTGCGDAFAAGMVVKYLRKHTLYEIAEYANRLGAFVAMHPGAIPDWTESKLQNLRCM